MSFIQNPKNNPSKIHRKRLSQDQIQLLESCFDAAKKLEPERKFQLARQLGVPPRQIAIWYQNKRARWKNQSLELDYGALQLRLDAALADKKQLEKEVDILRVELKRTHDMLFSFRQAQSQAAAVAAQQACAAAGPSSLSSCSSSLNEDVGCSANWANGGEGLQFEELYACLMLGGAAAKGPVSGGANERDFWV